MADFAFCHGTDCPLRSNCLRYRRFRKEERDGTLERNPRQVFIVEPFDKDTGKCIAFVKFQRPVT